MDGITTEQIRPLATKIYEQVEKKLDLQGAGESERLNAWTQSWSEARSLLVSKTPLCRFCRFRPAASLSTLCDFCHDDAIRFREEAIAERMEYRRDVG